MEEEAGPEAWIWIWQGLFPAICQLRRLRIYAGIFQFLEMNAGLVKRRTA